VEGCFNPIFFVADKITKERRSWNMSRIRGKGNKSTELKLLKLFREHSIKGWRRHQPLPGKPDFIFPEQGLAVFVDGCFWHGCPKCYHRPKSNQKFWDTKMVYNRKKDRRVSRQLRSEGWSVCRIWECRLKKSDSVIRRIRRMLG
jgi:DNA mismatch endonuclease, patch repair protein